MLYRQITIWKRTEAGAVRYVCFEDIASGRFCVQSADFFHAPATSRNREFLEAQIPELFVEQDPGERAGWFSSLMEAIEDHDLRFS